MIAFALWSGRIQGHSGGDELPPRGTSRFLGFRAMNSPRIERRLLNLGYPRASFILGPSREKVARSAGGGRSFNDLWLRPPSPLTPSVPAAGEGPKRCLNPII